MFDATNEYPTVPNKDMATSIEIVAIFFEENLETANQNNSRNRLSQNKKQNNLAPSLPLI